MKAMQRASIEARRIAADKKLKMPIWENGKVIYIDPTESPINVVTT